MSWLSTGRSSELLIGLSLAELFLLFILLMWMSVASESAQRGPNGTTLTSTELEAKNRTLTAERDSLSMELEKLRQENAVLLELEKIVRYSYPNVPTADLPETLRHDLAILHGSGGRGKQKCAEENLLLDVVVYDHAESVLVNTDDATLLTELGRLGAGMLTPHQTLTGSAIKVLLAAIDRYNRQHDCRFDYRLKFKTADDYLYANRKYERLCYPAPAYQLP